VKAERPQSAGAGAPPAGIRVVTWNLWWRFGPWRDRAAAIRAVLLDARPDICGLQEVWADDGVNLAGELAAELEMSSAWNPSPSPELWQQRAGEPAAEIGNAVLTRWPISETIELRLPPGDSGDEARTAILVIVDAPGGRIPFATTQLTPAPWDSASRRTQVLALAGLLAAHDVHEYPVVLTGDLNAEPDSDEVRLLCGHKTPPARPGFVLVDAWRYAESDAIPWTWDRANPHVAATMEPSARIDYVLVGPPRDGRGRVSSAERLGHRPVRGVWPSDHAGLLVELGLERLF
jgi:endonuclease/exonuclease/phosphatase family metal-dependent hydrolase